ncbi:UNVERIFIED_ORG: hypothetical protein [Escherichia phage CMSTMSU]
MADACVADVIALPIWNAVPMVYGVLGSVYALCISIPS